MPPASRVRRDLELEGIRKTFPGFTAIEELDLVIPAGSFFALLGLSGCGKTTTLRLVAGLEEPTAGRILIGGKDVTAVKPHKRPVNTVFQSYALFPHMSVLDNVAFGLQAPQGVGRGRLAPTRRCASSSSTTCHPVAPASSPAASSSASRSPAPS